MPYVGRQPTPSPVTADDIPDNSIDASKIVDGAIAVADVADNAITEDKIADATVVNLKSGRKNLIINGGFDVWQRGTSGSGSYGFPSADRWKINASGGTVNTSRQAFTDGQTDVPGNPRYFFRMDTTSGNNNAGIHQPVEDVRLLAGREVTLSFWAKGTNPGGGSFLSSWIQDFGTGGSSNVETEMGNNIVVTSSWQKFTITNTLPSVTGKTIGDGSFTWAEVLRQPSTDTSTDAWQVDIANVQLELGSVATEFEHRSYGEELALCQRYYHKVGGSVSYSPILTACFSAGSAEIAGFVYHPVEMRVVPTFGFNNITNMEFRKDNDTSFSLQSFTPNINSSTTKTALVWFGGQNTVGTGYSGFVRVKNGTTAELSFNAEL